MNEFQFIDTVKQQTYKQGSLIKGIGDDAAVIRPSSHDIVTAVDTFVDHIHFSNKTMDPYHIGYRALAANISDMAAMGAEPKFYLVSITIPTGMKQEMLKEIYRGMKAIGNEHKMDLIGGDTISGNTLAISVTIIGYVVRGKARFRHDAKEDDIVFVTGTLGDSRAGLYLLLNGLNMNGKDFFVRRHKQPAPRVAFAKSLEPLKRVALNDISDGIANELREIAEASKTTIIISDDKMPVSEYFSQFSSSQQYDWKYFGGEDFELVGTAAEEDWQFIRQCAQKLALRVTKIGKVAYNKGRQGQVFIRQNRRVKALKNKGYIHKVGE